MFQGCFLCLKCGEITVKHTELARPFDANNELPEGVRKRIEELRVEREAAIEAQRLAMEKAKSAQSEAGEKGEEELDFRGVLLDAPKEVEVPK